MTMDKSGHFRIGLPEVKPVRKPICHWRMYLRCQQFEMNVNLSLYHSNVKCSFRKDKQVWCGFLERCNDMESLEPPQLRVLVNARLTELINILENPSVQEDSKQLKIHIRRCSVDNPLSSRELNFKVGG